MCSLMHFQFNLIQSLPTRISSGVLLRFNIADVRKRWLQLTLTWIKITTECSSELWNVVFGFLSCRIQKMRKYFKRNYYRFFVDLFASRKWMFHVWKMIYLFVICVFCIDFCMTFSPCRDEIMKMQKMRNEMLMSLINPLFIVSSKGKINGNDLT